MAHVKSRIITFFVTFAIWIVLVWEMDLVSVAIGIIASVIVSASVGWLFVDYPAKWTQPVRYWYFLRYIGTFLKECVLANVDVAWRIVQPEMPINPGIVKVKTKLRTEAGLTFLANSITLTPGTLSVDIDPDEGIIYVHWINVRDEDLVKASNIIVKRFEKELEKVFE
ncbi:MAG: cation:proton antiporter [Candidatus Omnitrophica bacterium]|nr:cation:proton antiporter [Candidatus Omnitrophota bacterium]